jgi:hypothetical protein
MAARKKVVKQKKNERISVRVLNARASFLNVNKPNDDGKFVGDFLIPKKGAKTSGLVELKKAVIATGKRDIKADWEYSDNPDLIIKDGDQKFDEADEKGKGDTYKAYKGCYYITPKRKYDPEKSYGKKPVVVKCNKDEMTDVERESLKSGDYFNVVTAPYMYDYRGKLGIALSFDGLQFVKTGEALGTDVKGAVIAQFEEIEAELDDVEGLDEDDDTEFGEEDEDAELADDEVDF